MAAVSFGSSILSAVVGVVLDKATTYAQQQFVGAAELKQSIQDLHRDLSIVKGMISDAESRVERGESAALRAWLRKLKDVAYNADDVFDRMEYEQLKQKAMSRSDRIADSVRYAITKRNPFTSSKRSFVAQIKTIQEKLGEVFCEAHPFQLVMAVPVSNDNSQKRMTTCLSDDEENIIGREKQKEEIIRLLLDDDSVDGSGIKDESSGRNRASVVAIVGMGGLGKTTLAQLIFQDKEIDSRFEMKIWACVSDDFSVGRINQDILQFIAKEEHKKSTLEVNDTKGEKLCKQYPSAKEEHKKNTMKVNDAKGEPLTEQDSKEKIKELVRDKRFLLVLDDIWNEDIHKWDDLVKPFDCGKVGSKILITSRKKLFASKMPRWKLVELDILSDEDLNSLLMKHVVYGRNDHQLQQIGMRITKKLSGSPLAAKTIGHILSSNPSVYHWNTILECEIWDLQLKEGDIMSSLLLSYKHLPVYLKPCFAFCSIFPKDFRYPKKDIIYMWIALGLVQQSRGTSSPLEDIGYNYVNELLNMSMFEPCKDDTSVFVMHDLIHDTARMVSKDEMLMIRGENLTYTMTSMAHNVRHLAIHTDEVNWELLESFPNLPNLRSLLFLAHGRSFVSVKEMKILRRILSQVRNLRILGFTNFLFEYIPNCFSKLQCLRYLKLPHARERKLPSSIFALYHLQILDLDDLYIYDLPHGLNKLMRLRHLPRSGYFAWPQKITNVYGLESLQEIMIRLSREDGGKIRALKGMKEMQKLRVEGLEYVKSEEDAIGAELRHMKHLRSLLLEWDEILEGSHEQVLEGLQPSASIERLHINNYHGKKYPYWLERPSLANLRSIKLWKCDKLEILPPLGQIPCLESLDLKGMKRLRVIIPDWFRRSSRMSTIKIDDCPELQNFFSWLPPTLSTLELSDCPNIRITSTVASAIVCIEGWLPPELKKLKLVGCGVLSDMLVAEDLESLVYLKYLDLGGCNGVKTLPPRCSAHLRDLLLYDCNNLELLPTSALKRLEHFVTRRCHKLNMTSGVSEGLRALTSLRFLSIVDCPTLLSTLPRVGLGIPRQLGWLHLRSEDFRMNFSNETYPFTCEISGPDPGHLNECLHYLRDTEPVKCLKIKEFSHLELFDADIEDNLLGLESLERLEFENLPDLRSLPKRLRELSVLIGLRIRSCPKVDALPDGGVPASLKWLRIKDCPELEKRFAEERHKMSHVTYVDVWEPSKPSKCF